MAPTITVAPPEDKRRVAITQPPHRRRAASAPSHFHRAPRSSALSPPHRRRAKPLPLVHSAGATPSAAQSSAPSHSHQRATQPARSAHQRRQANHRASPLRRRYAVTLFNHSAEGYAVQRVAAPIRNAQTSALSQSRLGATQFSAPSHSDRAPRTHRVQPLRPATPPTPRGHRALSCSARCRAPTARMRRYRRRCATIPRGQADTLGDDRSSPSRTLYRGGPGAAPAPTAPMLQLHTDGSAYRE